MLNSNFIDSFFDKPFDSLNSFGKNESKLPSIGHVSCLGSKVPITRWILDVSQYKPEDILVKVNECDHCIVVSGKRTVILENGKDYSEFERRYALSSDINLKKVSHSIDSLGNLIIIAEKLNDSVNYSSDLSFHAVIQLPTSYKSNEISIKVHNHEMVIEAKKFQQQVSLTSNDHKNQSTSNIFVKKLLFNSDIYDCKNIKAVLDEQTMKLKIEAAPLSIKSPIDIKVSSS